MARVLIVVSMVGLLGACAANQSAPPARPVDPLERMLRAAAVDVSASLRMLAETNNAAVQPHLSRQQKRQAVIAATRTPSAMERALTVNWEGPVEIEAALATLAQSSGYALEVVGDAPTPPIIVYVYSAGQPLINVLRDVAYQAGSRAAVDVFEKHRKIVLRYAA